ncbi:MAG TPA: hypothetical protein VFF64_24270 [Candidatus Eremiobacteraceae bacterium]|nr:hypothetical protein [Candidatus Eremiobacteraceae bacterium]
MIAHAPVLWVCALNLCFSVSLVLVALHYRGKANVSAAKLQVANQDNGQFSEDLAAEKLAHAAECAAHAETKKKLNGVTEAFAVASAGAAELDAVGREMLQELEGKFGDAAYFSVIVPFLKRELSYYMDRAASLSARSRCRRNENLDPASWSCSLLFSSPEKYGPRP